MHFWSFCSQLENVIIHWRTVGEINITHVSSSRPQRLFEAVAWSESTIGLLHEMNYITYYIGILHITERTEHICTNHLLR